jgi:hypothetical protein
MAVAHVPLWWQEVHHAHGAVAAGAAVGQQRCAALHAHCSAQPSLCCCDRLQRAQLTPTPALMLDTAAVCAVCSPETLAGGEGFTAGEAVALTVGAATGEGEVFAGGEGFAAPPRSTFVFAATVTAGGGAGGVHSKKPNWAYALPQQSSSVGYPWAAG